MSDEPDDDLDARIARMHLPGEQSDERPVQQVIEDGQQIEGQKFADEDDYLDIDWRPQVEAELRARAKIHKSGRPYLEPREPERWIPVVRRLAKLGKKGEPANLLITIQRDPGMRTPGQNRVYWLLLTYVITQMREKAQAAGTKLPEHLQSKEDCHEAFKALFLGVHQYEYNGKVYTRPATSTKLLRTAFDWYVEKVRDFVQTEWDLYVPTVTQMMEELQGLRERGR